MRYKTKFFLKFLFNFIEIHNYLNIVDSTVSKKTIVGKEQEIKTRQNKRNQTNADDEKLDGKLVIKG